MTDDNNKKKSGEAVGTTLAELIAQATINREAGTKVKPPTDLKKLTGVLKEIGATGWNVAEMMGMRENRKTGEMEPFLQGLVVLFHGRLCLVFDGKGKFSTVSERRIDTYASLPKKS